MKTLKDKARFFAQYWGQNVFKVCNTAPVNQNVDNMFLDLHRWSDSILELTPLSSITDEHAIEVAKMIEKIESLSFDKEKRIRYVKNNILFIVLRNTRVADYMRKNGYALPYDGISVEEQIELGWVKLKSLA